jgi:uncharacterized protein (TIGR02444 family)
LSESAADAFWRFSLARYAAPGVAAACLELQDRQGADVNLLLLALWLAECGHRLDGEAGTHLAEVAAYWQKPIVAPLRSARRHLKERLPGPQAEEIAEWRGKIAAAELAMERLEQRMLEQAVGPVGSGGPDRAAASGNLMALGLGRLVASEAWGDLLATVGAGT